MKLCLVKVEKLDACIRPLFANSVTYTVVKAITLGLIISIDIYCIAGRFSSDILATVKDKDFDKQKFGE